MREPVWKIVSEFRWKDGYGLPRVPIPIFWAGGQQDQLCHRCRTRREATQNNDKILQSLKSMYDLGIAWTSEVTDQHDQILGLYSLNMTRCHVVWAQIPLKLFNQICSKTNYLEEGLSKDPLALSVECLLKGPRNWAPVDQWRCRLDRAPVVLFMHAMKLGTI